MWSRAAGACLFHYPPLLHSSSLSPVNKKTKTQIHCTQPRRGTTDTAVVEDTAKNTKCTFGNKYRVTITLSPAPGQKEDSTAQGVVARAGINSADLPSAALPHLKVFLSACPLISSPQTSPPGSRQGPASIIPASVSLDTSQTQAFPITVNWQKLTKLALRCRHLDWY